MKRSLFILMLSLIFIGSFKVSAQIISDNLYAFGFENVFKWNIASVDKIERDVHLRMIMFEDIASINERMIVCQLTKLENNDFKSIIKKLQNAEVVKELKNPYSENNIVIIKKKNENNRLSALIDHFGYVINVAYIDMIDFDQEKFIELIKTYINIKLDL